MTWFLSALLDMTKTVPEEWNCPTARMAGARRATPAMRANRVREFLNIGLLREEAICAPGRATIGAGTPRSPEEVRSG